MQSFFTDKTAMPTKEDLRKALGRTHDDWNALTGAVKKIYPAVSESWSFSGKKYGWSFRVSDKKRVIIYLLPRKDFFKIAFVFGPRASAEVLNSDIADEIKKELREARVYTEGRGIRLEVKDSSIIPDLKKLIWIKINI